MADFYECCDEVWTISEDAVKTLRSYVCKIDDAGVAVLEAIAAEAYADSLA